ncbi:aldehyde dehydrogenase family protein [Nakamurella sp. YIM 132087]|uniref:Aldehyde dehydrogenase family protein n=2 Tax=Nakamurella alba TaxID=2665158 RepID=A0A7K1FN73_9ACTN|nr:aldehyde dehydrogenase family protein [Nakamurella alba]
MPDIISVSPQRPDDIVVTVADVTPEEVAEAAAVARKAQSAWAASGPAARSAALSAAADAVAAAAGELAALVVREVGKPAGEAAGEIGRAVAILRYYAQQPYDPVGAVHDGPAGTLLYTRRRPHGVAGLITPWNFPIAIPLWKAAPALAFGNAVLLKPAPPATACALRLAELLDGVLPAGVFQVLPGEGATGQAVIEHADVVSFTGSGATGGKVVAAATARNIPVQAEMGGQNPAIVLPDADLTVAARSIAAAAMGFAGQKCTATKRVVVVGDPAPFRAALLTAVGELAAGDPSGASVAVGPVIDAGAVDKVVAAAASAVAAGATVVTGGEKTSDDGYFVAPTVVENVPAHHLLATDEVFGPICTLSSVDTLDEAIAEANRVRYGLVGAVYTRDIGAALQVADRLEAGMVKINAPTSGVDFYLPFGGEKQSSTGGREQGKAAAEFYTSVHTVTLQAG